jgi:hypothetical protein
VNYQTQAVEEVAHAVWNLLGRQKLGKAPEHGEDVDPAHLPKTGRYEIQVRVIDPDSHIIMHYDIPIDVETYVPEPCTNATVHWPERRRHG